MKKVNWIKITGYAILIHIILIGLSILTVFIYSYLINTGHPKEYYESFAETASPYVSAIGGFILMYWFVIRLNKKKEINPFIIGIGLPVIYIIIDLLMVVSITPDLTSVLTVLLISNTLKLLAGIIASYRSKLLDKK